MLNETQSLSSRRSGSSQGDVNQLFPWQDQRPRQWASFSRGRFAARRPSRNRNQDTVRSILPTRPLFLCSCLEGSPFFIPHLPATRGFCSRPWKTGKCPLVRPAVARERSRGSWNESEGEGAVREDTAASEGWALHQRGVVCLQPQRVRKTEKGGPSSPDTKAGNQMFSGPDE